MLPSRPSSWSVVSATLESSSQVIPSGFSSDASSARSFVSANDSPDAVALEAVESPIDRFLAPSGSIEATLKSNSTLAGRSWGRWSLGDLPINATSALPSVKNRPPPPNQPLPPTPDHRISFFSTLSRRTPTPPPPPPPPRSNLRPLPEDFSRDPSEQLRQQVQRQRLTWLEHLALVGLAQEHQRQIQARKGSAPSSSRDTLPLPLPSQSTPDLSKHQRSPSAPDYSPSLDRKGSLVSISAYSGTSSALQQAVVARRPERLEPGARSASAEPPRSLEQLSSSRYNRNPSPNSALLNAVHLPERAAEQNRHAGYSIRRAHSNSTRPAWPINHVPRESLELKHRSFEPGESENPEVVVHFVESPTFYEPHSSIAPRVVRSTELSRPPISYGPAGDRDSGLPSDLLEAYFGESASFRDVDFEGQEKLKARKGKDKMEKLSPEQAPPSTARSNFTFSQASDLEQGLSRSNSARHPADTHSRAGAASTNASHVDGSYLAASDLETGGGDREPDEEDEEDTAWGPTHPCFPHLNPHVPINSPLHQSTRIIRIKRDYMIAGDLAPTYSNLYPEILDPWVSEEDFRDLVKGVNDRLVEAYNPFSIMNIFDILLALLTFWLWDDLGFTFMKRRLRSLEVWLEDWNTLKSKQATVAAGGSKMEGSGGGLDLVKVYPMRSTAYLSIDIQIPDPKLPVFATADDIHNHNLPGSASRPETQDTAVVGAVAA